jgi:phage terminase small subunit
MIVKQLTPKQEKFVSEYISNGNDAKKAAISAGYSQNSAAVIGCNLLKSPIVSKRVKQAMTYHAHNCGVTFEWCVTMLKSTAEKCLTGDGLKDGAPNPGALVSAVQELNRMMGNHAPDKVINANVEVSSKGMDIIREMLKGNVSEY